MRWKFCCGGLSNMKGERHVGIRTIAVLLVILASALYMILVRLRGATAGRIAVTGVVRNQILSCAQLRRFNCARLGSRSRCRAHILCIGRGCIDTRFNGVALSPEERWLLSIRGREKRLPQESAVHWDDARRGQSGPLSSRSMSKVERSRATRSNGVIVTRSRERTLRVTCVTVAS